MNPEKNENPAHSTMYYTPFLTPQKPKSKLWVWLLGIGLVMLICLGGAFASCGLVLSKAGDSIKQEQEAKTSGVKIAENGCRVDKTTGIIKVDLIIKNTTKDQQTYFIDVFVKDGGGIRLANGTAMVTDVRPGQEARHTEAIFPTKQVTADKIVCTIDKVS